MSGSKYTELLKVLKDNVWVSKAEVSKVEKLLSDGAIDEEKAVRLLQALQRSPGLSISQEQMEDEWKALAAVIRDSEDRIKKSTKLQLIIGLLELPLFIGIIIIGVVERWFGAEISSTLLPLLIATLGAVIVHSFFVMRTHQQTSIAIERLAEKRLAILFLRIAASTDHKKLDIEQLLSAGTSMFMNHHAPTAIPLSPEDLSASKPS